jgi:hypothetical protein
MAGKGIAMRLDPAIVQQQISNLLLQFPELQEDEQLRADMIEGETDAHEFLRVIERKRQDACVLANAIGNHIGELKLRLDRFERREEAMRALAFKIMNVADLKKLELPEATLSIRNGTQKVLITNEAHIPDDLCRIKREPNKTAIKDWLMAGNPVPGAELSNAEPSLSIRTK